MRIIEALRLSRIDILVFRVTAHLTADRKGILDRTIIFRTRMRECVAMMPPRTCRKIQCRARLRRAVACRDGNNASCSIRAIDGSTTAFDNFDLLYIVDAGQCAEIDARFISRKSIRVIVDATAINENDDASLTIDGKLRIEGLVAIFTTAIAWCRNTHAGNIFQGILYRRIIVLLNIRARDDVDIAARRVGILDFTAIRRDNCATEVVILCRGRFLRILRYSHIFLSLRDTPPVFSAANACDMPSTIQETANAKNFSLLFLILLYILILIPSLVI